MDGRCRVVLTTMWVKITYKNLIPPNMNDSFISLALLVLRGGPMSFPNIGANLFHI